MVVTFFYMGKSILPKRGFGYLIPRSIPYEQNPENALGVSFDSDIIPGLDSATGTKVTVMLGGHWWNNREKSKLPSEEEGVEMARRVLKRHLGIGRKPDVARATLCLDCIPQYNVGHREMLQKAHEELMSTYYGRLAVAGSSYTGVSVPDCVRSAFEIAARTLGDKGNHGLTGLEQFAREETWVWRI
jgi:oxygen-dependent protoporphyrinogen oxidase